MSVSIKRSAAEPSLHPCAAAKLCLEREETDQANEYVKRSLAANPKDGYALLIKGQLALQMGQFYVRKHAMKGGDKAAAKCAGLPCPLDGSCWLAELLAGLLHGLLLVCAALLMRVHLRRSLDCMAITSRIPWQGC